MNAIVFDTLDATKTLRSAGVDERTAEAIVAVVRRTIELPSLDHLATRQQVDALEARIDGKIVALDAKVDALDAKVEALDKRLTSRFDDLKTTVYAAVGFQLVGLVGVAAFLYAVLKHA